MELFPAIDLSGGKVVRLTQGDFDRMKIYGDIPADTASGFKNDGAKNLHLVDLDGAKGGSPRNMEAIGEIASLGGLFLQVGGGIRDEARIREYLSLGVSRVILGTIAVEDFPFLQRTVEIFGDKIAVSVDAKGGRVATRGWRQDSGLDAFDFCQKLKNAGVSTIIFTEIENDGMMRGISLDIYRRLSETVACDIIASGGVSSKDDVTALRDMGLYGTIVGKALYEGSFTLAELVALC